MLEPRCICCWDGEGLEKEGTGELGDRPPLGDGATPPGEGEEISWGGGWDELMFFSTCISCSSMADI